MILHGPEYDNPAIVSKVYRDSNKQIYHDHRHKITVRGKEVLLVYKNQDYTAKAVYEGVNETEQWLLVEHPVARKWLTAGSICYIAHICGSDTNLDFKSLRKSIADFKVKDTIYDRQHKACTQAPLSVTLSAEDIQQLIKDQKFDSLSPEEALFLLIEKLVVNKQRREEFLSAILLPYDGGFKKKIINLLTGTPEYAKALVISRLEETGIGESRLSK